jgi:hypothetical protein
MKYLLEPILKFIMYSIWTLIIITVCILHIMYRLLWLFTLDFSVTKDSIGQKFPPNYIEGRDYMNYKSHKSLFHFYFGK